MRRAAFLCLVTVACAPSAAQRVAEPIGPARAWASPLHRDHPLAGRIWDVRAGAFVDDAALAAAAARARVLFLGETHDNPDHHLLQARLVRSAVAAGGKPAVAFEMLTPEQQPAIDGALAAKEPTADAIGKAVKWDESGWPPFRMYRPIFAEAVAAGLPVVGANLPRSQARQIVKKGKEAIPAAVAARIDRRGPATPEEEQALKAEMEAAHCGELPAMMMAPMLLAQRSRDAQMAEALAAALHRSDAVVLVTGAEHARRDRGVPAYLFDDGGEGVVSVAFREVAPEATKPEEYGDEDGDALPFDYVVFTPGAEREDPCEALRKRSRDRREQQPAAPAAPAPAMPPPPAPGMPAPPAPATPPAPAPAPTGP